MTNPYTFQPYKKYKAQFWNGSVSWCQPAASAEYFKNSHSEVSSDGTIDNDSTTACSNQRLPRCDCVTTHDLVAKVEHDQLLQLASD